MHKKKKVLKMEIYEEGVLILVVNFVLCNVGKLEKTYFELYYKKTHN